MMEKHAGEKSSQESPDSGFGLNPEASRPAETTELNLADTHDQLARGLQSRHIQFLALGGAIGTGLFVGSGKILSTVGPAPLFMAYISMMAIVWVVMNDLAEMVVLLPMRGITVPYFVSRFVDPSLAFAAGWNYWYAYAMLIGAEATAAGIVINYWTDHLGINQGAWIAIVLAIILLLNVIAVSFFGEAEFWFASIKLIAIVGLIILGIVIFFGGGPNQHSVRGFSYWKHGGAFKKDYISTTTSTSRFLGYWYAFIQSGFAYITTPELIAIAAGETVAPRRNIPKAARRFVWRLAIFYGLGSLVIGIMVKLDDKDLLNNVGSGNAKGSPFVLGIQHVGIKVLDHIINAVILTSAWSAGNSFLYSGSRVLYSMSTVGTAPKFFGRTNRFGVPWVSVLFTWMFGLLAFLNVKSSSSQVFTWFTNISTISGFIAWIVVLTTYLRFRKAMEYHGLMHTLPYKTPLQPYATWFALGIVILLTLTNGFHIFCNGNFKAADFVAAYITLPLFAVLYIAHKLYFRGPLAIPTHQVDVTTGVKEMDELAAMDQPRVAKNWLIKIWHWLA